MSHDYGFDLPDTRHTFVAKDGDTVHVNIVRHWRTDPDDEDDEGNPTFDVSFNIDKGGQVTHLPVGTDQEKAIRISHELYEEDEEATLEIRITELEEYRERRMGA